MKRIRIALTGAALLATAALTPVAAGGPQLPMAGKPKPVSPPTTRPSHPAHPAHPAKPAKPGHPAHPAKPAKRAHPAHPARPAHPAKPAHPAHPATPARPALRTHGNGSHKDAFAASKGKGHEKTAHHKVLICHRTGSSTNPYVVIEISINAWRNGHSKHPAKDGRDDILLKDPVAPGTPKPDRSVCGSATTAAAALSAAPAVQISRPAQRKRAEARKAAGGVLGVTLTRRAAPASNRSGGSQGVLGAVARVGSASLPFTGFPLWLAALIAVGLIAAGTALRRGTRTTR